MFYCRSKDYVGRCQRKLRGSKDLPPLLLKDTGASSNTSSSSSSTWLPVAQVQVTDLRKDPNYITYYINWFGFISTGVLPMMLLVFFNVNIYRKVLETR